MTLQRIRNIIASALYKLLIIELDLILEFVNRSSAITLAGSMKNFRRKFELAVCRYTGVEAACNETAAQYYARFFAKDLEYWDSGDCGMLFYNTQSRVTPRSHRRRFVPDCKVFKIATKSQFILTILVCPSSSWKQIANQNLSGKNFSMSKFFADFAECPDLIRNRRLSVFIGVCPSLSQSILVHRGSQIGVYR